jgi:hypothetical protein
LGVNQPSILAKSSQLPENVKKYLRLTFKTLEDPFGL